MNEQSGSLSGRSVLRSRPVPRNSDWASTVNQKVPVKGCLDKAIPVFWKHGFAETTVQDLEEATGVNKSRLYAEFENKDDLFIASLRRYLESCGNP